MAAIFIRTLIIYIMISVAIKFMGKRQIGELEVSELVSTLLISEIAALPIADQDIPLLNAIIPLFLLVCLEIIVSFTKNKSEKIKRAIEGKPAFIIYQGKLNQDVLAENRISVNELLSEMRIQGVGDIRDIYYAILEPNGKLSIIQKNNENKIAHALIIDGYLDEHTLSALGYGAEWLEKELLKRKMHKSDIFLMTVDDAGDTYIIRKENK